MPTRNLRGKELEDYKDSLELTDVQKDAIVGTLLGDASMSLRSGRPHYSIKFEQGEIHANYVDHLYEIFEPFTGTPPMWRWIDRAHTRRARWFRTYRHDKFIFYWSMFYEGEGENHRKKVPKNIAQFLSARALAYWFMDDGSKTSDGRTYYLNTQGFSQHECEKLRVALKEKFNIIANLSRDRDKWRLYITRESAHILRTLIQPYVITCFEYRLNII